MVSCKNIQPTKKLALYLFLLQNLFYTNILSALNYHMYYQALYNYSQKTPFLNETNYIYQP